MRGGKLLDEYFPEGTVMYRDGVADWVEAVDVVTAPLVDLGRIKPSYVEAIKASIRKPGGTYIDLGQGIAMAHARPEAGVVTTSLSVLKVGRPFLLADSQDHPISTFFCLAAQDSNSHLSLMQSLATFLSDGKNQEWLGKAANVEELRTILKEER
ncbi:PTS sugar transporter subunit IIA [Bifidobacterium sp. B4107]|uniref:PTS sugar transporter subunit IIA n=1 Tax=unclassified Bifidobacterium TaxID=2608897 RepID=UPI00226B8ECA|nr:MULTISPECIES: PTS sugar transporter subunit IIA [unclassified Bifidobacterium]MCX8648245.1 PTS sugar transporter subunit IIA [Bifidobacterium sp. B4107]MCX8652277.1 PTS sugar transporter subunit IIA [Bifidobacterium sp. B4111]MCX8658708.1 PTS sugar transporter subunit IIA [Bifidobacterium sp. B4114]